MYPRGKFEVRFLLMFLFVAVTCLAMGSIAMAAYPEDPDNTYPVVTSVTPADGSTIYTNGSSTTYYQLGNTTPLVIKADYSDEVGGSGIDVTSVMVHLDGDNMLMNCPVQTEAHVECTAIADDLFPGTHPLDIYVADMAGHLTINRTYVTVTVDNAAPTYSNLVPAGGTTIYTSQLNSASTNDLSALRIDYDLTDPDPSSGWSPMSHINDSIPPGVSGGMISNTSCVKTPATNPTHYSCQMNRAKLLHLGDNTLSVLLKDKVGNTSSDYSNPATLKHYTVVDDVLPAVTDLTANATTISANFSDPAPTGALSTNLASGINTGTAQIKIDGTAIATGCTVTATGISCATPDDLAVDTYNIDVVVDDNAGNHGLGTGSLNITTSPAKAITDFTIPGQTGTTTIDEGARTIALTMPYGTDVTTLVPTITHTGVSIDPANGSVHDFTNPSTYTVTAENGSTRIYTVTVSIGDVESRFTEKWNALNGQPGAPINTAQTITGGKCKDYANGRLYYNQAADAVYYVHGGISVLYNILGGHTGPYGLPTSDEIDADGVPGGMEQNFVEGRLYWSINTGTHGLQGTFLERFDTQGGPAANGLPTTDAYPAWGGWAQNMQSAYVTIEPGASVGKLVRGGVFVKYQMLGGPGGPLHLITAEEHAINVADVTGEVQADFQNGYVFYSDQTGSHPVNGGIYVKYLDAGGPEGALGLPMTDEYSIALPGGGQRQRFQHGFITWGALYGTWVDFT